MLRSENRLKKRKEFNYIYKKGESFGSKFVALYCSNTPKRVKKVGFSVSKKIGKAYVRNKLKRQMRAIVREQIPNMQDNIAYIFVAKSGIETLSFIELKDCILNVLFKSGKLKK